MVVVVVTVVQALFFPLPEQEQVTPLPRWLEHEQLLPLQVELEFEVEEQAAIASSLMPS